MTADDIKALIADDSTRFLGSTELLHREDLAGKAADGAIYVEARELWLIVQRHLDGARNVNMAGIWRLADGRTIIATGAAGTPDAMYLGDDDERKRLSRTRGWHLLDADGTHEFIAE